VYLFLFLALQLQFYDQRPNREGRVKGGKCKISLFHNQIYMQISEIKRTEREPYNSLPVSSKNTSTSVNLTYTLDSSVVTAPG
jgi:hypothetical protein